MEKNQSEGPVLGKKRDLLILLGIVVVLGLWVLWSYILKPMWMPDKNLQYAWVYHENELLRKIPLDGEEIRWELEVPCNDKTHDAKDGHKHTIIIVTHEDRSISVENSDCPDHICVNTGKVSMEGQSIACLPNRVIIKIGSEESAVVENESGIDG